MTEEKSIWSKIWDLIMALLNSSTKTQSQSETPLPSSETLSGLLKSEAESFLKEKAAGVALQFGDMLASLSPKQQEYVKKVAILKAANEDELSFDEVLALGEILNECLALQIEITEDLSNFWTKVGDLAKETAGKFAEVGLKLAAKSIIGFLPI